ncbi:tape measure protein [Enterococcus plantarum]|uniref:tape measure protein n=1 Tax=Enterococcus plantarum TaxID=1077675 RepID=UPI00084D34BA|nr:tape measure protein [Enterococcus plantarum]OEG09413.1 tape measure protein [Enterococcus plantarum]
MESYSVEAILSAVDKNFTSTMDSAGKSMGGLEKDTQKTNTSILDIAKGVGVFKLVDAGVGMVKESLGGAISRFDTLNKYPTVMQALGYSAQDVDKSMQKLSDGIDGLPTSLDEIVASTQQFAISTGSLEKGTDTAVALNNAFLASGASSADAARGAEQYRQMLARGEVDMQSWRSVLDTMPIGMDKVAKSFRDQGVNSTNELYDALKNGNITFDEFNNRLIELNDGVGGFADLAQKNSKGIATSFANIRTAVVKNVEKVIRAFDEGLQGAGFGSIADNLDKVKGLVNDMFGAIIAAVPPALKMISDLINTIKPFTPVILGLIAAYTTYQSVMSVARTAQAAYNGALAITNALLNANPIGLIITAVILLVGTIVYLWNTNEDFRNAVINIWKSITATISNAADAVVKAWDATVQWFSDMWKGLQDTAKNAAEGIKEVWSNIMGWFSNQFKGIQDAAVGLWNGTKETASAAVEGIKNAWAVVKQWFADLWAGAISTASGLIDGIMQYVSPLVYGVKNAFIHMSLFLKNLWKNIINMAKNSFNIIKNVIMAPMLFVTSFISGGWEEAKNNMINVWNNIKESANNIWKSITDIISNFFLNIKMSGLNVWYGLKNTFINIWTEILSHANDIWESVKAYFSNLWLTIKENAIQGWIDTKNGIAETWANLKQGAADTIESVKNFFVNGWQSLKDGTKQTWDNIKNGTINAWEAIKKFFFDTVNNIVDGAKNAWENLKNSVSNAVKRVGEIFNTLKSIDLLQIGKDIIDGLVNGIRQKIEDVRKAVTDVANSITGKIKKILDINSPSREMFKLGGFTSQGLAGGILDGADEVEKASEILAEKATPNLDIGSSISEINSDINGKINHDVSYGNNKQSATFNIKLGNQQFKAFVSDISDVMGGESDINLSF